MSGLFGNNQQQGNNYTAPMEVGVRVQTSAYGMVLPVVYGTNRITGNLMWYGAFTAVPHTTTTSSGGGGGKGGGGQVTSTSTTWTYTTSFALGLCEGQISGIGAVWKDKDYYSTNNLFTLFNGSAAQAKWGYMTTNFPSQSLNYRRVAYVAAANYDLGSNPSMPNHSFEVIGLLTKYGNGDCNPKDVLTDYLSNSIYGAGLSSSYFGNWTQYSNYCLASGLLVSPVYDSQVQASESVTQLMALTNSGIYFSEGLLKITPYGDAQLTGNGVTYYPNVTPVYDITDDDYIWNGDNDPVIVTRVAQADAYNQVQIEFINRANQYNTEIAEAKDQANIEAFGARPKDSITAHMICEQSIARAMAQLVMQRALYVRNNYEFTVGIKYALLEPTDYITLTDSVLGLDKKPVRITSITENDDYTFKITAEDAPAGVSSNSLYPTQTVSGHQNDYNVPPGNTNQPVIFEAPDTLTSSGLEVWIGASGGNNWGGCQVWVSYDGNSYQQIATVTTPARQGLLTAVLPVASDPDTTSTLKVNLSMSYGTLQNATQQDANQLSTLSYVDGELISYANANLTSQYNYTLSYLRRGCYNTPISSHAIGKQFCRLDSSIVKIPFRADQIGTTIYIKVPAFNIFNTATQALADVQPYTYVLSGSAYLSSLPNVVGLFTNYNNAIGGLTVINWSPIDDFRQPNIEYEIRLGDTWATAKVLGRTFNTSFVSQGDGTYWIAGRYTSNGVSVYSTNPSDVTISGSSLRNNVIAEYKEQTTGWSGAVSGGATVSNNTVKLASSGGVITNLSGYYTNPTSHTVNGGRVSPCNVAITYTAAGVSLSDNILTTPNVLVVADILHSELGQYITVKPQIAMAAEDGVFGSWQDFLPGYYNAQYFKARFYMETSSNTVTPLVSEFNFSVDVPDRVDTGTVAIPPTGSQVVYSKPFNGGLDGNSYPNVQVTIVSAQTGDDVILTSQTSSGFTVQITNGGTGVARTINWLAQGY